MDELHIYLWSSCLSSHLIFSWCCMGQHCSHIQRCWPRTYRAGPSSGRLFWKRGSLMSSTTRTGEKMNLRVNIFKPEGEDSRARRRLKSNRRYTFVCFADLILIIQRPGGPTSSLVWTGSDPERQICGLLDHKSPPKSTSRSRTS